MHKQKQQGFVSIIVASILMIILTLITIGLSRLMQREQRQSLDRQLSTQAFYAAETGVNDVQAKIQNGTLPIEEKSTCDVTNWPDIGSNGVIDPAKPEVSYTCLTYDPTPPTLEFNNGSITSQDGRIFPVRNESGGNITNIRFEWIGASGVRTITEDCSNNPYDLPPVRNNRVPILRVDLIRVPTTEPAGYSRDNLINQTVTAFLYPQENCGAVSAPLNSYVGTANNIQNIEVDCDVTRPYPCSFEFTDIHTSSLGASDRYFVRTKTIYGPADMLVNAASTVGGEFEFVGAQTVVDSTGKANDVVRRIRAHLSNSADYPIPEYVFQSMDGICKRLGIASSSIVTNECTFN